MTVREMIRQLEQFAAQAGDDAEFMIVSFDEDGVEAELRVLPDEDRFDFEVLRGDSEVVVELRA